MDKLKKIGLFLIDNIKWIVLIVTIILLFEIVEDLFKNEIYLLDNMVYNILSLTMTSAVTATMKVITQIGSAYIIIPICLITMIIFRKEKFSKYIFINLAIVFLSNLLLKNIVARQRPVGFRIVDESGYSFPSAHSMVSMAFYGFFIYLIYKKVKNKYIKYSLIILLSIIILLIGISRIYLGVHYASDVFAGFCISLIYLIIFTNIIGKSINKENKIETK